MKNFKKILAVLMIAVLAFGLVACGGGGGGANKPSPVGTYTLTGMTEDGEETSQEDLELMASLGLTVTMEFKDDNTGALTLFGEAMEFTWDDSNITMEGESVPYTFDGTTLTLEQDGTSMTFTKDA